MLHDILERLFGDSTGDSVGVTLGILFALLTPVALFTYVAYRNAARWFLTVLGITFGAVASPLALWLYVHRDLDPVRGFLLGLPGKALINLQFLLAGGGAAAEQAIQSDPLGGVATLLDRIWPWPTLLWVACYGAIGFTLDLVRNRREAARLMAASRPRTGGGAKGGKR